MANNEWTVRNLLAPVSTRLLIYGMNPFDLEEVISGLESVIIRNSGHLEKIWFDRWNTRAEFYLSTGQKAEADGLFHSASAFYRHAAQCRFATFLISTTDMVMKKQSYELLRDAYAHSVTFGTSPMQKVTLPLDDVHTLTAYLHLPPVGIPLKGSVVLYAGLGSCKEEMHTLARPVAERGVAVLVPDMPGCGESLLVNRVPCSIDLAEQTYRAALGFLQSFEPTRQLPVGSSGLCMGGGYAYRAAALNSDYRFCAALFPLFISDVADGKTPQWMMSGEWYDLQTAGAENKKFRREMGRRHGERLSCPFFLAHGKNDNWMTLESAMELFDSVDNDQKEKVIVGSGNGDQDTSPALHTMPVGEQLHWVKHVFADWLCRQADAAAKASHP